MALWKIYLQDTNIGSVDDVVILNSILELAPELALLLSIKLHKYGELAELTEDEDYYLEQLTPSASLKEVDDTLTGLIRSFDEDLSGKV